MRVSQSGTADRRSSLVCWLEKPCTKCGITKPLDDFSLRLRASDGRQSICKSCAAAYQAAIAGPKRSRIEADRRLNLQLNNVALGQGAKRLVCWLEKPCKKCRQEKPLSAYWKSPTRFDGREHTCIDCKRKREHLTKQQRQAKRREQRIEYKRSYRRRKAAAAGRQLIAKDAASRIAAAWWKQETRELRRLAKARTANPATHVSLWQKARPAESYAARYKQNIDFRSRERERQQRYKHANPAAADKYNERRYARLVSSADGTLTAAVLRQMFATARKCPYCDGALDGRNKALDHIVPVARGGAHSLVNVIVCCRSCNLAKRDRMPSEWESRLREPNAERFRKLYVKRFGAATTQQTLGLAF